MDYGKEGSKLYGNVKTMSEQIKLSIALAAGSLITYIGLAIGRCLGTL